MIEFTLKTPDFGFLDVTEAENKGAGRQKRPAGVIRRAAFTNALPQASLQDSLLVL